ncbi:hypothetical protein [Ralstonia solanacearum]|uniref:hypothetical protein n=1 Tax=Ralstonia solanacearum TaxID=305 RepID=UPI000F6056FE|nr:hypothetical protein [Ralstonia solanacearum]MCL9847309.1 hypothetical protein [Ralstonia solanacearum]MDC6256472.1 hypothetical protein [Ralstonia solanacearum]MDC6261153.1 hypothetical protein [Ralstonia solanacearum]MDC6305817.1 hypothetical protein [Ralstonia solanacearum]
MSKVWVYKHNGTVQCDSSHKPVSLGETRKTLEALIGSGNVLSQEERTVPMIQLCGAPTGNVNAYEITEAGWSLLRHGTVGSVGFERWSDESKAHFDGDINIGQVIGALTSQQPQSVQQLVGHPLRVYQTGDALTKDWRPDRVNIETKDGVIVSIWYG